MSIKGKTGLILVGFFILHSLFSYGIQHTTIYNSFEILENKEAQKNLFRSLNAIYSEIDRLESLCRNWAVLDNIYNLPGAKSGDDSEPALPSTFFTINRFNIILFFDVEGNAVWWDYHDLVTGERKAGSESVVAKIQATTPLLSYDPNALMLSASGILPAEPYPLLVTSHPIMVKHPGESIKGHLIIGRFLTPDLVEEFSEDSEVPYDLFPLQGESLTADLKKIADQITPEAPQLITADQEAYLYAYTTAPDLNGEKALLVRSKIPRDTLRAGKRIVGFTFFSMLIGGVFLFFGLRHFLQRVILSPVSNLTSHMILVGRTGDLSSRIRSDRHDEIGKLAKEFEGMLEKLAEKDNSLEAANTRLEEEVRERQRLIDELEKALSEVKTLSGMLPICASCKKIRDDTGYWNQIESYIGKHSDAQFSHGICPDCAKELYKDLYKELGINEKPDRGKKNRNL